MMMRVFTLRFSPVMDGFDDSPITEFLGDKAVLSLKEHFFIRNEIPYLAIVITYDIRHEDMPQKAKTKGGRKRDESWRDLLQDTDMPVFNTLRDWRSERCKKDGVPPYVVCNNKQLAQIAVSRPQTVATLMQVDGFGKAKADKYGSDILEVLAGLVNDSAYDSGGESGDHDKT